MSVKLADVWGVEFADAVKEEVEGEQEN